MEEAIKANTAVTESIKTDTSEIVALMKGGKVLGALLKWAAMVAAAIGALGIGRYLKLW